jgi:outer membrane biosynthesis protein TonB
MTFPRRRLRKGPRGPMRIVILVRRIDIAVALSVLAHAILFAIPVAHRMQPPPSAASQPMQVVIASPQVEAVPPAPQERPREPVAQPAQRPPAVASRRPVPQVSPRAETRPAEAPTPAPEPTPPPAVDMMAAIEARRASRRAAEAGRNAPPGPNASEDAATRNLKTLTGGEGVGGVFEILRKGTRTGEFAFNGWRPESRGQWRVVIEVDAGLGGDIELAMVRRMIELIREYYSGDFKWESHRLQRVVTLSARAEDTAGLEDFMMREFFGQPTINPRRR